MLENCSPLGMLVQCMSRTTVHSNPVQCVAKSLHYVPLPSPACFTTHSPRTTFWVLDMHLAPGQMVFGLRLRDEMEGGTVLTKLARWFGDLLKVLGSWTLNSPSEALWSCAGLPQLCSGKPESRLLLKENTEPQRV